MDISSIYQTLYRHYGPQHWWPGDTPFEVMVGAVLTQNTSWTNVEKAIANLKAAESLSPLAILSAEFEQLAAWLKPSGYFNVKAQRLRNLCAWYVEQGGMEGLAARDTLSLREALLSVKGVGAETADDILLYAFARPVFVIDAYTRRIFARLGLAAGNEPYEALRSMFESALSTTSADRVPVFNEYHGLIVRHGKNICRTRPLCAQCCLAEVCPSSLAGPAHKVLFSCS